jgi:nicotinate dehydrogenase subunit B
MMSDIKKINELDFRDVINMDDVSRRSFLKGLGGGIILFFTIGGADALAAGRFGRELPSDFNAFLRIGKDGRVTGYTGKIEMGQGPITSLPQMLAEEMDVDVDKVTMVMGDTALCPWDMGTFGSMTTRFFGPPFRAAAAEARAVLVEMAAEKLAVPKEQLDVADGVVFQKGNESKKVSYAELAAGEPIARRLQGKATLKTPDQFKVMGKPRWHVDAEEKVTGKALYAGDIRLPGMAYTAILRPPSHASKLVSADTSAAESMEGVKVIRDGDMVAILHPTPDGAEKALRAVKAEWDTPEPQMDDKTIFDYLLKNAGGPRVVAEGGDLDAGRKASETTVETTYLNSYVAHAPIEPHAAIVNVEGEKATVWASSQTPFSLPREVAAAAGLDEANAHAISPFVGGGFGGKSRNQQAGEAARLSKLAGRPVQVAWTRQEEFFYDTFRPAAIVKISSGIDKSGSLAFWDYGVYYAGERGAPQFYNIPNHRTASYDAERGKPGHPFGTGAWRAPANNTNTFARESQIDAMAAKAGMDPVEFRLKNLTDERMISVLKAAAKEFGWTPAKTPSGRGYGVACGIDAGTYVATMCEAAVDKATGHVQVKRVVAAQDMGVCVNPEGAMIQMEGCVTMGLGYALGEEIHFQGGQIEDVNFGTYPITRFSWVPDIKTVLVKNDGLDPQGGGEPAIIVMGAVVANAIFDATGARLLQLPMTEERVRKSIEELKA